MEAVARVVVEAEQPLSPLQISQVLKSHGREDAPHLISPALNYLKRKHRVHSASHGFWQAGPPSASEPSSPQADDGDRFKSATSDDEPAPDDGDPFRMPAPDYGYSDPPTEAPMT
jgi:hypothetical protein